MENKVIEITNEIENKIENLYIELSNNDLNWETSREIMDKISFWEERLEEYKKMYNDPYIVLREYVLLNGKDLTAEEMKKQIKTSLVVESIISNDKELKTTMEKSMKRRYELYFKNEKVLEKNKKNREKDTIINYPASKIKRGEFYLPQIVKIMDKVTTVNKETYLEKDGNTIKVENQSEIDNFFKEYKNKPMIFVPTHISKHDIEVLYEIVRKQMILLSGTEERLHNTINGLFLDASGINRVDRSDKNDRKLAFDKMRIDLLLKKYLMYFPEGTWNVLAEKFFLYISYKFIKLALETDAYVVPVGTNYNPFDEDKKYYTKICEPYKPSNKKEIQVLLDDLKEKLATSRYELMELSKPLNRSEIDYNNYHADIIQKLVEEWPETDLLEESAYQFIPNTDKYNFYEEFNYTVSYEKGYRKIKHI